MSVQELGNDFSDGKGLKEEKNQGRKNSFAREKFESEERGNRDIEGRLRGESEGNEGRGREEGRRRGYWDDYEVEYASPLTDESCIPLSPIEERYLSPCPELDEYPGRNNATFIHISL